MVENVSQQPLNVKSAKEELEASSKALADSLEQKGAAPQSPPIPEALKVKEEQTEIKTSSAGKDLADSDLEPDE
jgi:small-conductance mechanosensitive channel